MVSVSRETLTRAIHETPCLTYVEERLGGARHRGGCLWHKTKGPDRDTEAEAQADCRKHLVVEYRRTAPEVVHRPTLPGTS